MTEDIYEQLALAAQEASRLARKASPRHLTHPTPCPDYDVRALATHLLQEIVIHSWDLAAATHQVATFPTEVTETVLRWLHQDRDAGRTDTWYDSPVTTTSPSTLDRVVALSGRDPNWPT